MSRELIARIRKNRELKIVVEGKTFLARRPTDLEILEIQQAEHTTNCALAQRFVFGWEAITENDIFGDGGSDAVKFDPLLWREWVADRPDFWEPISDRILAAYTEHRDAMKDVAKN